MGKPRIAILGGGASSVAAALQLSKPGWQSHFASITLYQQGWRLGGKGACGRGEDQRIQEHGLHIWFGFYENAFGLLQRCHEALAALPKAKRWPTPFTSVDGSFEPLNELAVADNDGCAWRIWMADFFDETSDRPWLPRQRRSGAELPRAWPVAFYLERCLRLAADFALSLVESDPSLRAALVPSARAVAAVQDVDRLVDLGVASLRGDAATMLATASDLVDVAAGDAFADPIVLEALDLVLRAVDEVADFLRRGFDSSFRASRSLRRAFYVVDLMVAIARGLIEDDVIVHDSFDVIDDIDLRAWLLEHGATRESVDCALIRALVYDLGFAYEDGDPRRPACAAGTALRGLLRAFFTYRGSLMWRMKAGMGDVVFLPFYELLVSRKVDVRFFHRVEALRVAGDKVVEIDVDVQAKVPAGTPPEAFVGIVPGRDEDGTDTGAGPRAQAIGWPASPSRILGAPATAPATASDPAPDYESWYLGADGTCVRKQTLRRGEPNGFDLVVFGLPISVVPNVAKDLVDHSPRWRDAVAHLKTVPTQALQLWLNRPMSDLAADLGPGTVASGYVEPFDTWADMSHLVRQEAVPGSRAVAYFCNVLPDRPPPERGPAAREWLEEQNELVRAQALRFLKRDIGVLWPGAVHRVTGGLDWDLLVAPARLHGKDRLCAQYLRANVEPSERYVLSVPGSGAYRFAPDDTGFTNLYAVGDWTACGIDAGCVEAAVISGMLAANAIHRAYGDPAQVDPIIGFEHL